jgi:hypothetical protein
MNGQTPPRRKRPTRPDPQPSETPRPTRRSKKPAGAAKPVGAGKPATPPPEAEAASAAPPAAPPEPTKPPIAVFAPAPLPDRLGDVSPALTPRQLAFMAVIAAVILAVIRRLFGGRRKGA